MEGGGRGRYVRGGLQSLHLSHFAGSWRLAVEGMHARVCGRAHLAKPSNRPAPQRLRWVERQGPPGSCHANRPPLGGHPSCAPSACPPGRHAHHHGQSSDQLLKHQTTNSKTEPSAHLHGDGKALVELDACGLGFRVQPAKSTGGSTCVYKGQWVGEGGGWGRAGAGQGKGVARRVAKRIHDDDIIFVRRSPGHPPIASYGAEGTNQWRCCMLSDASGVYHCKCTYNAKATWYPQYGALCLSMPVHVCGRVGAARCAPRPLPPPHTHAHTLCSMRAHHLVVSTACQHTAAALFCFCKPAGCAARLAAAPHAI